MVAARQEQQTHAYKLPEALTPLLGRDEAVGAILAALFEDDVRLLTLLGPGGVGKTRLAIEVGREVERHHGVAVHVVPLAHLVEPESLLPEVAERLGVKDSGPGPIERVIAASIQNRPTL